MENYEVAKTDVGHVVFISGKYHKIPDSCARLSKDDLKYLFEGGIKANVVEGVATRADVPVILHGEPKKKDEPKEDAKAKHKHG
jgi:hypothetical protein